MQMQKKDILYGEISRHNPVTMRVKPGEVFQVETELNSGDWLKSAEDLYHPDKDGTINASSGCIHVEGAKPGDMLKVKILDIQLDSLGYTCWRVSSSTFPDLTPSREWYAATKTVRVENGFVHWSDRVKLPVRPMIGVAATAPELGCPRTVELGQYGGNMDIQEVAPGNTLYLPVFMEGALLHTGDVHAIQGDGEICGAGGIEIASVCTLQVDVLLKPEQMLYPRLEGEDWIGAVGIASPMEEAFRIAVNELANWMVGEYGFTRQDAVLLLGQVLEARCTQIVDPQYSYVAKIKKEYLVPGNDAAVF